MSGEQIRPAFFAGEEQAKKSHVDFPEAFSTTKINL